MHLEWCEWLVLHTHTAWKHNIQSTKKGGEPLQNSKLFFFFNFKVNYNCLWIIEGEAGAHWKQKSVQSDNQNTLWGKNQVYYSYIVLKSNIFTLKNLILASWIQSSTKKKNPPITFILFKKHLVRINIFPLFAKQQSAHPFHIHIWKPVSTRHQNSFHFSCLLISTSQARTVILSAT